MCNKVFRIIVLILNVSGFNEFDKEKNFIETRTQVATSVIASVSGI